MSALLGLLEPGVALDFDCACALWARKKLPTPEEMILRAFDKKKGEEG